HAPSGRRRARVVPVIALTAAAMLIAACGGDNSGSSTATTAAGAATTAAGASGASGSSNASPATTAGDADTSAILRYGPNFAGSAAQNFDPVTSHGAGNWRQISDLIYDTIIHESANGGEEPGLATQWSAPDDSTVDLTFRTGVMFQDGTPMDINSVKFSVDRVI